LESTQRKEGEVVRDEGWLACKERLNDGLFSLEEKQHKGSMTETSKTAQQENRDHLICCGL